MKIISACLVYILLAFFCVSQTFAETKYNFFPASEGQVNEAIQKIVPVRFLISSPAYFLISFKEGVNRFFQPSALKKAEFDMTVSGKKIKEAYLLIERGDVKNSSRTLKIYSERVSKMSTQIEKARSQNQDVSVLVDVVAENLRLHETLFFAINEKWGIRQSEYSFEENFASAVSAHSHAVMVLDNIKPGIRDRFSTTKDDASEEPEPVVLPSPLGTSTFDASPSVKPRKIIF